MNKKAFISIMTISALVLTLALATGVFGAEGDPGSSQDPVVTKSYVDRLFQELAEKADGRGDGGASTVFTVVEVSAGSKLLGAEGTELILRGGKATAIDNGKDGISDLTAGADLKSGKSITANHLLLVPKEDGRGITCTTKCWVMVKGAYTIQ